METELHGRAAKRYLKHLVLAGKRIHEREAARAKVEAKLVKSRSVEEYEELADQIQDLIKAEYGVLQLQHGDVQRSQELSKRVQELELILTQKMRRNYLALNKIQHSFDKIERYLKEETQDRKIRQKRYAEIEKHIDHKMLERNKEVALIEKKLASLEKLYVKLEVAPELQHRVDKLNYKMEIMRKRLEELKGKKL